MKQDKLMITRGDDSGEENILYMCPKHRVELECDLSGWWCPDCVDEYGKEVKQ